MQDRGGEPIWLGLVFGGVKVLTSFEVTSAGYIVSPLRSATVLGSDLLKSYWCIESRQVAGNSVGTKVTYLTVRFNLCLLTHGTFCSRFRLEKFCILNSKFYAQSGHLFPRMK